MLRATLRASSVLLGALLLTLPAPAQAAPSAITAMDARATIGEALDTGAFSIQSIDVPAEPGSSVTVDVTLGETPYTLALQRWSIRSSEHFEVLAQLEDGSYQRVDVGPSQIWRGVVLGVPGSRVSASLTGGQLDALVRLHAEQPVWAVQPLRDAIDSADRRDHVIYSAADGINRGYTCGGALVTDPTPAPPAGGYSGVGTEKVCEIACDADVEFYNKNGSSVANTEADIELIIDRVQNIYQPDVSISYEITTIIVRTAEPDPYTSTSPGTLLSQFRNHWNSSQGGVVRDVAHLFTGKNINGGVIGIASLSVICNLNSAYGLSESRFSGNLAFRTGLTAHELGHNWSAGHCDGAGDCWIMCSGLGGCAGDISSFGNGSKSSISNKKNSVGCLSNAVPPPAPTISAVSPTSIGALGGVITVTGQGMDEVSIATLDGQDIAVTVASETSVTFLAPFASSLGAHSLTVTNVTGVSNSISLHVVAESPPKHFVPGGINTSTDTTATWTFAGSPGDIAVFLLDFDQGTFPFHGFSLLASDFEPLFLPLNAAGVGQLVVPIDPSLRGGGFYHVYVQLAFLDPSFYFATGVSGTIVY